MWQHQHGKHRVGVGIIVTDSWPQNYRDELSELSETGIHMFTASSPDLPFTLEYLRCMLTWPIIGNPIVGWVKEFILAEATAAGPPVLHFHNAWLSGGLTPVRYNGSLVPMIATYHGIAAARVLRRQPLRRYIHAIFAKRFVHNKGLLASVDRQNTKVAEELFGIRAKDFTVIPNGFIPNGMQGCPRLHGAKEFVVGHVGGIDDGKGWRFTAAALDQLHEAGFPVRFLIAGKGPQAAIAQQWCSERPDWTEFLGFVKDAAANVIPRLDAYVLPSLSEGLPMTVIESFAAGVPVLATPVGGLPDTIIDGVNGFLIERDRDVIARYIQQLVENVGLHTHLSRSALESFETHFHMRMVVKQYDDLYRKAVEKIHHDN
ncbi:MAG: glycosyltransferase family 4 protein [Anaerolineae bacterium]|nr:glycosyltransferase family 4 protein [Anaerolineae bacterium]